MFQNLEQVLQTYDQWLERQPFSPFTRRAYRVQIHRHTIYLAERSTHSDDPFSNSHVRDYAIRDYQARYRKKQKSSAKKLWLSVLKSSCISTMYCKRGNNSAN